MAVVVAVVVVVVVVAVVAVSKATPLLCHSSDAVSVVQHLTLPSQQVKMFF